MLDTLLVQLVISMLRDKVKPAAWRRHELDKQGSRDLSRQPEGLVLMLEITRPMHPEGSRVAYFVQHTVLVYSSCVMERTAVGSTQTEREHKRHTCPQTPELDGLENPKPENCWCGWLCSVRAASPRGFGGASPSTTPRLGFDSLGTPDKASQKPPSVRATRSGGSSTALDPSVGVPHRGAWGPCQEPTAVSPPIFNLVDPSRLDPWWGRHVLGM